MSTFFKPECDVTIVATDELLRAIRNAQADGLYKSLAEEPMDRTYWLFDERDDALWWCDECGAVVPSQARPKHDEWHDSVAQQGETP